MTVGFGHGMAEPPLAIVRGTAATVNGGILLKPTLLEREDAAAAMAGNAPDNPLAQGVQTAALEQAVAQPKPAAAAETPTAQTDTGEEPLPAPEGTRVISEKNSSLLRRLLRLDVTSGTGRTAESPGYFVGGKTGTAEKIGPHGGYLKHVNISAFTGIFP